MLSLDLEHEDILPQVTEKAMFLGHTVTPFRLIGNPDQSP